MEGEPELGRLGRGGGHFSVREGGAGRGVEMGFGTREGGSYQGEKGGLAGEFTPGFCGENCA